MQKTAKRKRRCIGNSAFDFYPFNRQLSKLENVLLVYSCNSSFIETSTILEIIHRKKVKVDRVSTPTVKCLNSLFHQTPDHDETKMRKKGYFKFAMAICSFSVVRGSISSKRLFVNFSGYTYI